MHTNAAVEAFKLLCLEIGSEYALAAHKAVMADPTAASRLSFDYSGYHNVDTFRKDYLVYNYLRKYEGGADVASLTEKAKAVFLQTDSTCDLHNRRLRAVTLSPLIGSSVSVQSVISRSFEKIRMVLGDYSCRKWVEHCEWGPGATATIQAADATVDKKVVEQTLSVTSSALKYAAAYLETDTTWTSARLGIPVEGPCCALVAEFEVVEDGRFSTVPKDVKSRRSIELQPTMNLFLQKGVGSYIRGRLKRFGVDLDDQSRNQVLAQKAFTEGYSTIDLSSASDSICTEIVRQLLDPEWFTLLDDLRTKSVSIDGVSHRLSKFSSMGNGFTFELESLIFWALSKSVVELLSVRGPVSIYGDDIIVPREAARPLIQVLEYVGFTVNLTKSFLEGDFFESCGLQYFRGVDVTPIFQKEIVRDIASGIRAHNRLMRWGLRLPIPGWCDNVIKTAVLFYRTIATGRTDQFGRIRRSREFTPVQPWWIQADVGLIKLRFFPHDKHGILRLRGLRLVANKKKGHDYALYATSLRRGVVVENPFLGFVSPRGVSRILLSEYRFAVPANHRSVPSWL